MGGTTKNPLEVSLSVDFLGLARRKMRLQSCIISLELCTDRFCLPLISIGIPPSGHTIITILMSQKERQKEGDIG